MLVLITALHVVNWSGLSYAQEGPFAPVEEQRFIPLPQQGRSAGDVFRATWSVIPQGNPKQRVEVPFEQSEAPIYRNAGGEVLYQPGIDVRVADDIETDCWSGELVRIEMRVHGGGTGAGQGFRVQIELFDGCPGSGGTPIAGTSREVNFPDDGEHLLIETFSPGLAVIPHRFWLAVSFNTVEAGLFAGGMPDIGLSSDSFDGAQACSTFFGECLSEDVPCANFEVSVFANNCEAAFLGYRSNALSGFYWPIHADFLMADDIQVLPAVEQVVLVGYEVLLAGLSGPFEIVTEIWATDAQHLFPLAPVFGTRTVFHGIGDGRFERMTFDTAAPVVMAGNEFWIVLDASQHYCGPIMASHYPNVGWSDDCFSFAEEIEPYSWGWCSFLCGDCAFGGACCTIAATVHLAGAEPGGACCHDSPDGLVCTDGVPFTQCHGRWTPFGVCEVNPFDPPCGSAACCTPEEECDNLSNAACDDLGGEWFASQLCGSGPFECPDPGCIGSTNADCTAESPDFSPGCSDVECCQTVCDIDNFCCVVGWDISCAQMAMAECPANPEADRCDGAVEITCGSVFTIDNSLATDDPTDPYFSCHYSGIPQLGHKSVWAKFVATSSSARLRTCGSDEVRETLLAVYSGECGALTEIACDDDTTSCGASGWLSNACVRNLIPGQTYYVQVALGWILTGGRIELELDCSNDDGCPQTPSANDDCENAYAIGVGDYPFDNTYATTDGPGFPFTVCHQKDIFAGADIWYQYSAIASGAIVVDLCENTLDFDSVVSVFNGCDCPAPISQMIGCNDDGCGDPPEIGGASIVWANVQGGECYLIRISGYGTQWGEGVMGVRFEPDCPGGQVVFVNPPNGAVDARQPHPVSSLLPRQGISTITVQGPVGAEAWCWSMCETGSEPGFPNSIQSVVDNGNGNYTINLARPITPGAVMRVAYHPVQGVPTVGTFISHPGNVNGDSTATGTDILKLVDCLSSPGFCFGIYNPDINHSGQFNPADVLREIDLLNGADMYEPWWFTAKPTGTCTP